MFKFITASEAVSLVKDNDILCCGGFVGIGVPEELHLTMAEHHKKNNSPKNITLYYAAGQGDSKERGLNHYAGEGLVGRIIGGHWGLVPKLAPLANENKIEAYNLPQGIITHLFRAAAGKKPFIVSHVGLGTFVDPDISGGKLNSITKTDIVSKIVYEGKEYLQYKTHFPNICFLKGSSIDEDGNVSFENEPLTLEGISIATATRNNGGIVVVQVEKKVKNGSIKPANVEIPGILVDYAVLVSDKKNHMQTFGTQFNEEFLRSDLILDDSGNHLPLEVKKVIGRRGSMLLSSKDKVLNYGIGVPEYVANVVSEESISCHFKATVEPGIVGGTPAGGLDFGAARVPEAIIHQPYMFDFYDGGGIDFAFLGLAECDEEGNINVSKFGTKIAGSGGFINITQNAKRLAFCGTFTAGKSIDITMADGKITINHDGDSKKFVSKVGHITFSGKLARENNKEVYYITERAVFKLEKEGVCLIEIAPGVDLEKDILAQMDFKPIISKDLKTMDARIFTDKLMGLKLE